jgi:uncharacterized membrane protein
MNTNTPKTSMAACGILAIFAGLALAQEQSGTTAKAQPNVRYAVTDLGNVGPDGQPFQVTNNGLVAGAAMVGNGFALGINEVGQVAGTSGDCAAFNPITQDYLQPLHALLWEDQKITDLGTLGGTGQGFGILAYNLNNRGQVIG